MELPKPRIKGGMPLHEAIFGRESVRGFSAKALTPEEISQLLWSAQGRTRPWGGRSAPSAGALYPLELYVADRGGVYHYISRSHQLVRLSSQDVLSSLSAAALGQECVRQAPAVIVIAAVYERIEKKYGKRGERYVKIEAGHAAQNILLQAVSLGLGAVPVGAFYDDRVRSVLNIPADHEPLYLIPIGHAAGGK
ncbi:MAG: SagB/ThcOx family dehydrogenase [Syntrophales bacterium]